MTPRSTSICHGYCVFYAASLRQPHFLRRSGLVLEAVRLSAYMRPILV